MKITLAICAFAASASAFAPQLNSVVCLAAVVWMEFKLQSRTNRT